MVMGMASNVVSLLFGRGANFLGGIFLMLMSLNHMLSPGQALLAQLGLPTAISLVGGVILVSVWLSLLVQSIYG